MQNPSYENQTEAESGSRLLSILADAIEHSMPPQTALGYNTCWRCWWRVALSIMRQLKINSSEARDEIHRWLLAKYQSAAIRTAREDAA